jgi:DNA-directed RNA polymerase specialized sigma24 family protein
VESKERPVSASERFTVLLAAHHAAVLAYATRRVGLSDAEDIVADVFFRGM